MQTFLASLLSSPLFVLAVSLAVFVVLAWAVLPFALYGVRRRLDRIVEGLERIQALLEQGAPASPPRTEAGEPAVAEEPAGTGVLEGAGLLGDFREAIQRAVPELQERVLDARRIEYVHRRGWGREFPCLRVMLDAGRVSVSFPLRKLEEAYPRFSGEQFDQYVRTFLGERHGVLPASPPGAEELVVVIEPGKERGLEIFLDIVQEQLWGAMTEEGS